MGRRCARCTSYWRVPEKALFSSFVEAAVISSSPGELEPVFQTMLENATRVCGAEFGILFRYEGGLFHPAASNNLPSAFADFLARQGSFAPVSLASRATSSLRGKAAAKANRGTARSAFRRSGPGVAVLMQGTDATLPLLMQRTQSTHWEAAARCDWRAF